MKYLPFALLAVLSVAADFKDIDPNVFAKDDPRAKDMPKMVWNDVQRRMKEANLRESKAFAEVKTKEQWEAHRDVRIKALRDSLGTFPDVPKNMRIVVTKKLDGDGYRIHNLVYETRPGLWVSANLYLPAKPLDKMPGLIISHAHHTPKGQGELQDMGMTWARAGCAVLVPDHLGHGERRQHDFVTAKDYDKSFAVSRQDYYFRYNSNLQLSAIGDSLMGWMVWDLMRGIDLLLKQPGIDKDRIIMLGAVAGGGDPAGVTAALDPRIACVVPFNFSGWQPESNAPPDPDRNFAWFGEGYWESTRGLRGGAAGGFAHYVITGSISPRRLIYAHEFKWDPTIDPAWPRLQKIYEFYDAKQNLGFAHGAGKVNGPAGPDNTHCTHIGAVHRKMIYPYLKDWFGMPIPEEYSARRKPEELLCWTEEAKKELKPKKLHEMLPAVADELAAAEQKRLAELKPLDRREQLRKNWTKILGDITPRQTSIAGDRAEDIPGGYLRRLELYTEPGWPPVVPFLLLTPTAGKADDIKWPIVIMVSASGKASFLKERGDEISLFLKSGIAVALADVRATGEIRLGSGSPALGGARTSVSQTELILGQTLVGTQFRDLRALIHHLQKYDYLDGTRIGVWGDSFAKINAAAMNPKVPLELDLPEIAEPGGALLAELTGLFEDDVRSVYANGGLTARDNLRSPYLYVPHEAIVPGAVRIGDRDALEPVLADKLLSGLRVNGLNQKSGKAVSPADAAKSMVRQLRAN
jgi:cephalosporin-C deacetylase-like acetyl esterase